MTLSSRAKANRLLSIVLLCGFGLCRECMADEPPKTAVYSITMSRQKLEIAAGDPVLLEFPEWLTIVRNFDPSVILVSATRPNCLRIHNISSGKAAILVIDRVGRQYAVDLIVRSSDD